LDTAFGGKPSFFDKNLPLMRGAARNDYSLRDGRFVPYCGNFLGGGAKPPLKEPFPRCGFGMDGRNISTHGG
jgi:hypothetical protein